MADVVWPSGVSEATLLDGHELELPVGYVEFQPDIGPPMRRAVGTLVPRDCSMQLAMTSTALATFRDWYEDDLSYGTLSFEHPDPETGETEDWMFVGRIRYRKVGPDAWMAYFTMKRIT
jgi:hypothetical protein